MNPKEISAALVAELVAEQFPQWSQLPVTPVELDGWDNRTFRLGSELLARLPSADAYVAQVEKEHRWLPVFASQLPFPIPGPVAIGRPSRGFTRPWSIYRWLEGEPATWGKLAAPIEFAEDLARFLVALQRIPPAGGPPSGEHNFFRGGPLATYDEETIAVIAALAQEIDVVAATELWQAALATSWRHEPVWVHGDIGPSNILVVAGRLSAVIDFGCCGVGDPACDFTIAWTLFTGESRHAFRQALGIDEGTWMRARAWALWKALITLADARNRTQDETAAAGRFGWRIGPKGLIEELAAEYRRHA